MKKEIVLVTWLELRKTCLNSILTFRWCYLALRHLFLMETNVHFSKLFPFLDFSTLTHKHTAETYLVVNLLHAYKYTPLPSNGDRCHRGCHSRSHQFCRLFLMTVQIFREFIKWKTVSCSSNGSGEHRNTTHSQKLIQTNYLPFITWLIMITTFQYGDLLYFDLLLLCKARYKRSFFLPKWTV